MIKFFVGLLLLALLCQTAEAATYNIPVNQNVISQRNYQMVGSDNYSYQLQNPPAAYGKYSVVGGDAVGDYLAGATFIDQQDLTSTTHFDILGEWNGTQTIDVDFDYEKGGSFGFTRWSLIQTVRYVNLTAGTNTVLCQVTDSAGALSFFSPLFGTHVHPQPYLTLEYGGGASASRNQSANLMYFSFGDGIDSGYCTNPATGDHAVTTSEITEGINVVVTAFDGSRYNVGSFAHAYNTSAFFQNLNVTANFEQTCSGLPVDILSLHFCFDVGTLVGLVFNSVLGLVSKFLLIIPGGQVLYQIIATPFDMALGLVQVVNDLLFNNGSPYGVAGLFWMHEVYAFTLGCCATALTGNWKHVFMFPWKLAMAGFYITIYMAYFFFWLVPRTVLWALTQLWIAITNPIP